MCSSHHHSRSHADRGPEAEKRRFAKSVRAFLTFNLVMVILMMMGSGVFFFWKVSVIWGAILAIKGLSLYGWPDKDRYDDNDFQDDDRYREQQEYHRRPRRPSWRDKDLV
ncbi:MAG: 2TM domain-containing protein [Lewinella sp.]|nr:2TM domain-containing protein [Lewinella sp.]